MGIHSDGPLAKVSTPITQLLGSIDNCKKYFAMSNRHNDCMQFNDEDIISRLPTEVLMKIFSYLKTRDICESVPFVSKRWRSILEDRCFCKKLSFRFNEVSTKNAILRLQKSPGLKSLVLLGRKDADDLLKTASMYNGKLKVLLIHHCTPDMVGRSISEHVMARLLQNLPELEILSIDNSRFIGHKFLTLLQTTLPELKQFHFSPFKVKASPIFKVSLYFHGSNYQLEKLRFAFSPINYTNCLDLTNKYCVSLTSLQLNAEILYDECMEGIARCQKLQELSLLKARCISDSGLLEIGKLKNLKILILTETCWVTGDGWVQLFQFPNLGNLQKLTLRKCFELTDSALLACASTCTNIEKVHLLYNIKVHDYGPLMMFLFGKNIKALDYVSRKHVTKITILMNSQSNFSLPWYQQLKTLRKDAVLSFKTELNAIAT